MKKILAAGVLALGALGITGTGVAHADAQSYISHLENSGYGFYGLKASYLTIGYRVCQGVASGLNQGQLTAGVVAATGPGIYSAQARYIVEAAEIYLC